ncbi:hypothetical protein [Flavobacterium hungaricum]|uniref:Lipoprotein n=1 Tax=Flavobacterium hungaricum TaxID=2082725 RepID=A0ABR9TMH1_9FLAO|nr:hypothetical protein [Flavobacterium hungaricum]MBE8726520.1 hypothetical protein [Flavobacterium hungaricum]
MLFKKLLLLFFFSVLLSCGHKKEQELTARENEILKREQQFADKEAEYQKLLDMRDSLNALKTVEDSVPKIKNWPKNIAVSWNSKIVCRESNCSNYVIGDQRNEVWQFVSDSTGNYANVINNNKLIRVYSGLYDAEKITLDFTEDNTAKNKLKINIVLDDVKESVIKGTQTIIGQDNCTAKFSVELTPSSKK